MRGTPTGYWGKLDIVDDVIVAWHPLIDHMIDVAACAEVLLLRSRIGLEMERILGGRLCNTRRQRLVVIAFLHDLGKLNLGFQSKRFPENDRVGRDATGHASEAVALFLAERPATAFQENFGLRDLLDWFSGSRPAEGIARMLHASWSHHGFPVDWNMYTARPSDRVTKSRWAGWKYADLEGELRRMRVFAETCWPAAFDSAIPMEPNAEFLSMFGGFVSLADWIGSNKDAFPFSEPSDGSRIDVARDTAARVVSESGLDTRSLRQALASVPQLSFEQSFGFKPNPMQRAVLELPIGEAAA